MDRLRVVIAFVLFSGFTHIQPVAKHGCKNCSLRITDADTPSKALMIRELRELHAFLLDSNYSKAKEYFILPEEISEADLEAGLSNILTAKELSKSGIDSLEQRGRFGKLLVVYSDHNKGQRELGKYNNRVAEGMRLEANECYGLYIDLTIIEVMAHWDGKRFRFFRLDNVGKIETRGF